IIEPAHGPRIDDPAEAIDYYRAHRLERIDQVRASLDRGATTAAAVCDIVYHDVDAGVRPAAEQIVKAQLAYLDALPTADACDRDRRRNARTTKCTGVRASAAPVGGPAGDAGGSAGAVAHAVHVEDDDRTGLEADEPASGEIGEGLVHGLTRGTDELREPY